MNPQRPNNLNNDYEKGCKILRDAYASLFEGFASIMRHQLEQPRGQKEKHGNALQDQSESYSKNHFTSTDQKTKRDADNVLEKSKKYKATQDGFGLTITDSRDEKVRSEHTSDGSTKKAWGSWAQALHRMAMHPEKHKDDLLEISEDVVVLNDLYPKVNLSLFFFFFRSSFFLTCLTL